MDDNTFLIYQLKPGGATRDYRFAPRDRLIAEGLTVDRGNYSHMYTGTMATNLKSTSAILETLFTKFNTNRPQDFAGHSLSTSDVVVLCRDGKATAYYVDSFRYEKIPEFLDAPYRYYSTQRPVDIGTFPKTENGPAQVFNFDKRERVESATFRAWGYVAYNAPLTKKQIDDYELRAASDNPDHIRLSAYQLEAQAQIVGKWEKAHRVSEVKRLTWYHGDFGVFVRKEHVTQERLAERYGEIIEEKLRAAYMREAQKDFTNFGLRTSPASFDEKRLMIEQAQVVGHWEEIKELPDDERFTWHKPSISGFALREPVVSPEQLEQRYNYAFQDLKRDTERQNTKKPIAEQLRESAEYAARDNAARSTPTDHKDKGDRT